MERTFSDEKCSWYMENAVTGRQVKLSDSTRVHDIFEGIAPDERKDWVLKFGVMENLEVTQSSAPHIQIELPDGSFESYVDDSTIAERREFPRIKMRLRIIVISGKRIFRTFCENISLGGLLLEAPPPREYSHNDLKIIIENPDGSKKILTNMTFVDNDKQRHVKFMEMQEADRSELGSWLQSSKTYTLKAA